MPFSALDTFEATIPHVSSALVGRHAISGIDALIRSLPESLYAWGFECRLGAEHSQVDFGACIVPDDNGPELLLQRAPAPDVLDDAWASIRRLCAAWGERNGPYYRKLIRCMFLEYDLDVGARGPSVPSVFAAVHGEDRPGSCTQERTHATAVLDVLEPPDRRPYVRQAAVRCLNEIPPGSLMAFVAIMFARPLEPVRLHIWIPREAAPRYLMSIGLTRPVDSVRAALSDLCVDTLYTEVAFDVVDDVLPRMGIEFTFSDHARDSDRLARLHDRLTRFGLCTPEKRDALLAWPGVERIVLPGQPRPCVIGREISHLKVTYTWEQILEVKAYLAVIPSVALFG